MIFILFHLFLFGPYNYNWKHASQYFQKYKNLKVKLDVIRHGD